MDAQLPKAACRLPTHRRLQGLAMPTPLISGPSAIGRARSPTPNDHLQS